MIEAKKKFLMSYKRRHLTCTGRDAARLEYDADGNLIKESSCTKEAVYAYNAANRMAESHVTEIRDGSRQTPKDTVYSYDSFGRRILEADILNRWVRHTEYRGLSMDVWKNAAVHGIKEPRDSRGIDSTGMVFTCLDDFLPAFADFSRASPYDFTHVALTLPLGMGGEVFGLLQTEHSGIGFNPFVNASHTDAERHYFGKDHLGSVRAVTNQWGSPLYMFDYDVFGQPLQDRPERFRHGFNGKEYDGWTGLYYYGFRDYASLYGRFTTVDPIQDGHNWYSYVNSDPVSWLDPWGLKPCEQQSGEDKKRESYQQSCENPKSYTVANHGSSFEKFFQKADEVLSSKAGKVLSGGLQAAGGIAEAWLGLTAAGISGGLTIYLTIDGIRNIVDGVATIGMALTDIEYRGIVAESTTLFAESVGVDYDYAHYLGDCAGLAVDATNLFLLPENIGIAEALQRPKALIPNKVDDISSALDKLNVVNEGAGIYSDIDHLITEETDE